MDETREQGPGAGTEDSPAARLLAWYDANARVLPWRAQPGSPPPDPYRVWLSEIMLQQTTVAAVRPYFERFLTLWPTVDDLAAANDAEVMSQWAGLGYYARARNLIAAARVVAQAGGRFPGDEAALRQLPGVGDYTAAAIAAIAYDQRAIAVDANVERVVARLFALSEPLPVGRKAIRAAAETIFPEARVGDFTQALMDLGSAVCLPRGPKCLICPLATDCHARALGDPEAYPRRKAKAARPVRKGQAYWIERDGAVWLVRRPAKGMLGGMRALPDDGWSARGDGTGEPPLAGAWRMSGMVQHGFTHFTLELAAMQYSGSEEPAGEGEWWPIAALDSAGLPSVFARAAGLVRGERD